MASSINPYNINGNYPVAGQDNDSQGFRDNFTNLRNNLVFAKAEIEDLQKNALLKSALAGTSLDNNLAGVELVSPQLKSWTQTRVVEDGALGTVDVNFAFGNFYKITPVGDITLNFANFPNAGYGSVIVWLVINNTAFSVTLPSSGILNANELDGYDPVTTTLSFPEIGTYLYEISTADRVTYTIKNLRSNRTVATTAKITNALTLDPVASEPNKSAGTMAVANGTSWDPAGIGGSDPYLVFYNGTAWSKIS